MWFHLRLLEACNLKCVSCYARNRDRSKIMDFALFKDVLKTIQEIRNTDHQISVIYLSGGEPLLHPSIVDFIKYSFTQFDRVSILTNGILVKKFIKDLIPFREKLCVQVSLDGDEKTNDAIRGEGVYRKVIEALHLLNEKNINHWISYTVSHQNKHCYKSIIDIGKQTRSFFNNVTPYVGDPGQMLDYFEWKEFKYRYEKYSESLNIKSAHGPNCCGFNYRCGAFYNGITINPDGSAAGCARINNIQGDYHDMQEFILPEPRSIVETCMKEKWGEIAYFDVISSLE